MKRSMYVIGILLTAALAPMASYAQSANPLTIDEALRLSLDSQPGLDAYGRTASAFEEAAVAAEQLPDFRLFGGVRGFPVTEDTAFSYDAEPFTASFIGIGRRQTPRARRRADAARLIAEASSSEAERELLARRIEREVLLAWTATIEAEEQQALLQSLIDDREGRYSAAEANIPTGRASPADAIAARADITLVRAEIADARGAEAVGRAALSRWIGDAAERRLSGHLPICRLTNLEVARQSISDHPQLLLAGSRNTVADRAIDVARADRQPEWGWSVRYEQRSGGRADFVGFELSIDLPFNRSRLQDRRLAEASELAAASRDRLEDTRRDLLASLDAAIARMDAAQTRLRTTAEEIYPALRAAEQAQEARYAGGGGSLESVLIASDRATRIALDLVEQRAAVARASAELYYYTEECDI
ncbi:MAG: TolC family protein [Parasphingopyxis sp.]|uniref:TolC family protein n=1 Tax=Parasphingopyxis sp. TaxID=1920299 RepID=UPI0032ED9F91